MRSTVMLWLIYAALQTSICCFQVYPDASAAREIKRAKVFCPNKKYGCQETPQFFKLKVQFLCSVLYYACVRNILALVSVVELNNQSKYFSVLDIFLHKQCQKCIHPLLSMKQIIPSIMLFSRHLVCKLYASNLVSIPEWMESEGLLSSRATDKV